MTGRNCRNIAPLAFAVGLALVAAPGAARAQLNIQFRYGTSERPLQGRRYETMRALAHYLDEQAQEAMQQAYASAPGSRTQRRLLNDITEFARRANHFHERMDNYLDSPIEVPNEVLALERRAQAVNVRMRDARVFSRTYREWADVLDVLGRMKQSLQGQDVSVPPAHRRDSRDYARDYAPFQERGPGSPNDPLARQHDPYGGQGPDILVGSNLAELRRLASQLDDLTTRAHEMAEQGMVENSWGGRSFTETLHHFNEDTRALRQQSDAGQFDRRSMADSVNHLAGDAQRVNERLNEVNASGQLRNQWGQVIETLNRMSQILQR